MLKVIICPTAIAYSMGQIIKSVCVCVCVCLSVCEHSHGRISLSIFTKIGTDVRTPKRKNEFVIGVNIALPLHLFWPPQPPFRPKGPENPGKY